MNWPAPQQFHAGVLSSSCCEASRCFKCNVQVVACLPPSGARCSVCIDMFASRVQLPWLYVRNQMAQAGVACCAISAIETTSSLPWWPEGVLYCSTCPWGGCLGPQLCRTVGPKLCKLVIVKRLALHFFVNFVSMNACWKLSWRGAHQASDRTMEKFFCRGQSGFHAVQIRPDCVFLLVRAAKGLATAHGILTPIELLLRARQQGEGILYCPRDANGMVACSLSHAGYWKAFGTVSATDWSRHRRYHQVTQFLNKAQSLAPPNFGLASGRKLISHA